MKQERLKAICWKSSVTKQVHYHRDSNHLATQTANFNRSQKMQKKVYSRQKLGSADKDANDYDANDLCWFRIFFVSLPQKIKAINAWNMRTFDAQTAVHHHRRHCYTSKKVKYSLFLSFVLSLSLAR